ncbi:thiazolylpeptide-type bacteriocin [Solwaraspora sp. WMMD791]|uniref:thiazolylpeptide-type bacteriocin n=1 Tax=unclassified Solwaraspora TaxID=2627926 RepID=UPI00249CA896|nr:MULTISPECIES: thiazolylpeptide-type bacteriocin [unclassified Solwaraspora]WFE27269.1 thiazolylpeptide-type bacteriocin [Solwaraspora sp. WMMD791]WJK40069.1 thiazolylpeptide-type bacteriocin [Solwaraspora sp. WMMA2056]
MSDDIIDVEDLELDELSVSSIRDSAALPETGASSGSSSCSSSSCCGASSCCSSCADAELQAN